MQVLALAFVLFSAVVPQIGWRPGKGEIMTNRKLTRQVVALAAFSFALVACTDETTTVIGPEGGVYASLSVAIEHERRLEGVPGVAVAVVENGKVTYSEAFGFRDPRGDEPMETTTIVPIGAVTTSLTAIGILRLVAAGQVDLDAPVTDYIPALHLSTGPAPASSITIRNLLTHTSGLPDEAVPCYWPETTDNVLYDHLTSEEFADTYSLMFPPGRMYYHSSLGFDLLGLVIERVSGRTYADFMSDEVFWDLGMPLATFRTADLAEDGNYSWGTDDGLIAEPPFRMEPPWQRPSSLAYASVVDLTAIAKFYLYGNPTLLSNALYSSMISPQQNTAVHHDQVQQGFGLLVTRGVLSRGGILDYQERTLTQGGQAMGHTVRIIAIPERKFAIVFAANRNRAWFERSTKAALRLLLDIPEADSVKVPTDRLSLAEYAGTYRARSGKPIGSGQVSVQLTDDGLRLVFPPSEATCDLEPVTADTFQCPCTRAFPVSGVTFLRDSHGNIEYLRANALGFTATPFRTGPTPHGQEVNPADGHRHYPWLPDREIPLTDKL